MSHDKTLIVAYLIFYLFEDHGGGCGGGGGYALDNPQLTES